jgi:hypothetical protein
MSTTTALPAVGQRVFAVKVPGAEAFNGKRCEITSVSDHGILRAEFESPQKPDDTISLTFTEWAPIFAVGDTVRITTDDYGVQRKGKIGTVSIDDETIMPFYVTGYDTERPLQGLWMRADQIEHVKDGQTLTVSTTVPPEGALVRVTGYLGEFGIVDDIDTSGRMVRAEADLWTIQTARYGEIVSGPGYVTMNAPNPPVEPGDRVVCVTISAIDRCIGKEGVVESVCSHDGEQYLSVKFDDFEHEGRTYRDEVWNVVGWDTVTPNLVVETDVVEEPMVPRRELDRANQRVTEYADRASKWERDFNTYALAVMEEAIERDWCSEYERVMRRIEVDLEIGTIPERDQDVDIEWEETYLVTVRRTGTVSLRQGYSSEDVEEAAKSRNGDDDADASDIIAAVRNGNYSSEEYVDNSSSTL